MTIYLWNYQESEGLALVEKTNCPIKVVFSNCFSFTLPLCYYKAKLVIHITWSKFKETKKGEKLARKKAYKLTLTRKGIINYQN